MSSIGEKIPIFGREKGTEIPARMFTSEEKESLLNDGAIIYTTRGKNIYKLPSLKKIADHRSWPSLENILTKPSKISEVAIYPSPRTFFVPNSLGWGMREIVDLMKRDEARLRSRTGLKVLMEIPGLPDAIDVFLQHEQATGVRLLHKEFGYPSYDSFQIATRCAGSAAYIEAYERGKGWGFDGIDPLVYKTERLPYVALMRWVVPSK